MICIPGNRERMASGTFKRTLGQLELVFQKKRDKKKGVCSLPSGIRCSATVRNWSLHTAGHVGAGRYPGPLSILLRRFRQ
jgi:hypothetical protein